MPKCKNCGKWGLFLKVSQKGLCEDCEIIEQIKSKPRPTVKDVNELQKVRAKTHGCDLVVSTCTQYHCSECSKYINRVYSRSGKDGRFPRLPDYIEHHADHCGITLYPFTYGASIMSDIYTGRALTNSQVIEYSNRPYTDVRPAKWKEGYRKLEAKANNKKNCEDEYKLICQKLPDIAPKSQAGYTRMKKSNSENFKKIAEAAHQVGIVIHEFENED